MKSAKEAQNRLEKIISKLEGIVRENESGAAMRKEENIFQEVLPERISTLEQDIATCETMSHSEKYDFDVHMRPKASRLLAEYLASLGHLDAASEMVESEGLKNLVDMDVWREQKEVFFFSLNVFHNSRGGLGIDVKLCM